MFLVLTSRSFPFPLVFPYFCLCRCRRGVSVHQYEYRMCVEVMVFVWKTTACKYSIWFPYILSVVIGSNIELSLSFSNVLYLTFGAFQQINYILILQFNLWKIWNILIVWLLLHIVIFATCLQHKILLLPKHGVRFPYTLFANFLLTLPFSINLVPIMFLKFLFQLDWGLYTEDANVS